MTMNTSSMPAASLPEQIKIESPTQIAFRRFRQHKLAVVATLILLVIVTWCYGAPLFTPYEPLENESGRKK